MGVVAKSSSGKWREETDQADTSHKYGPCLPTKGFGPAGRLEPVVLKSLRSIGGFSPALASIMVFSNAGNDLVREWLLENINGQSGVQGLLLLCNLIALDVFIVAHELVDEPVRSDFDDAIGDSLGELVIV